VGRQFGQCLRVADARQSRIAPPVLKKSWNKIPLVPLATFQLLV